MPDQDDAQLVITRGQRSAELLINETFCWLINDQTQMHLAALCATPPGASGLAAREFHHLHQHAITGLVATLQGYVAAGVAMENALVEETNEEDDHS